MSGLVFSIAIAGLLTPCMSFFPSGTSFPTGIGNIVLPSAEQKKRCTVSYIANTISADYGARTRHLNLGKVALYQMS